MNQQQPTALDEIMNAKPQQPTINRVVADKSPVI